MDDLESYALAAHVYDRHQSLAREFLRGVIENGVSTGRLRPIEPARRSA
jgi:hypothetical protein